MKHTEIILIALDPKSKIYPWTLMKFIMKLEWAIRLLSRKLIYPSNFKKMIKLIIIIQWILRILSKSLNLIQIKI